MDLRTSVHGTSLGCAPFPVLLNAAFLRVPLLQEPLASMGEYLVTRGSAWPLSELRLEWLDLARLCTAPTWMRLCSAVEG